jgi:hypothetical protein
VSQAHQTEQIPNTRQPQVYQGSQQAYEVVIDEHVVVQARDGTPLATPPRLSGDP